MDKDTERTILAKLTVQEFFIEVILAQVYGYGPKDAQDDALSQMVRLIRTSSWTRHQPTDEESTELLQVGLLASEYAANLAEKIAARADNIRDLLERQ
ncbi:MAG: hypothetical protein RSE12_16925 [Fuscovulum sp.]|nr:MAG: hypothetical protein RSE12_16925 [Fuscovulum sp.]